MPAKIYPFKDFMRQHYFLQETLTPDLCRRLVAKWGTRVMLMCRGTLKEREEIHQIDLDFLMREYECIPPQWKDTIVVIVRECHKDKLIDDHAFNCYYQRWTELAR